MKKFRLLDMPPMTAAENMALDETLLELKSKGTTPDTVRFLQFSPPAVLVGRHQSVSDEVKTRYCKAKGIHINRRITGGGAIFFDESQLGWEIICEKKFFNISLVSDKLFKQICMAVIEGLKKLGVDAVFRPKNDIEINGRKISGTGGTELYGAFLFQGTLLVDFDVDAMIKSLKVPIDKLRRKEIESLKQRVTCLKRELGFTPVLSEIKNAVLAGFEKHLGIKYEFGTLTDEENNLFKEKVVYFQKNEWINNI